MDSSSNTELKSDENNIMLELSSNNPFDALEELSKQTHDSPELMLKDATMHDKSFCLLSLADSTNGLAEFVNDNTKMANSTDLLLTSINSPNMKGALNYALTNHRQLTAKRLPFFNTTKSPILNRNCSDTPSFIKNQSNDVFEKLRAACIDSRSPMSDSLNQSNASFDLNSIKPVLIDEDDSDIEQLNIPILNKIEKQNDTNVSENNINSSSYLTQLNDKVGIKNIINGIREKQFNVEKEIKIKGFENDLMDFIETMFTCKSKKDIAKETLKNFIEILNEGCHGTDAPEDNRPDTDVMLTENKNQITVEQDLKCKTDKLELNSKSLLKFQEHIEKVEHLKPATRINRCVSPGRKSYNFSATHSTPQYQKRNSIGGHSKKENSTPNIKHNIKLRSNSYVGVNKTPISSTPVQLQKIFPNNHAEFKNTHFKVKSRVSVMSGGPVRGIQSLNMLQLTKQNRCSSSPIVSRLSSATPQKTVLMNNSVESMPSRLSKLYTPVKTKYSTRKSEVM